MAVNSDKPDRWKSDIVKSVDFYNNWFLNFAPKTYRDTRVAATSDVLKTLKITDNLRGLTPSLLRKNPSIIQMLRMATAPPIARDRLIGLSGVSQNVVFSMEDPENPKVPPRMADVVLNTELGKIIGVIQKLADRDLFPWLDTERDPEKNDVGRAATVVADRLCGAISDPVIRNAQEKRQLESLKRWFEDRGYNYVPPGTGISFETLAHGEFIFRLNIPVIQPNDRKVNIPVDVAITAKQSKSGDFPIFIEAKSAGILQIQINGVKKKHTKNLAVASTYGDKIKYILFLCGYFDSGYLGYEAAEGIDWGLGNIGLMI
jgi:hypothetical protein